MKQWMAADSNGDNQLSKKEISQMLHRLNIDASRKFVNEGFKSADKDNSGYLDYMEFVEYYRTLTHRRELDSLFDRYSTSG
mgnify:CR=1 FL=1